MARAFRVVVASAAVGLAACSSMGARDAAAPIPVAASYSACTTSGPVCLLARAGAQKDIDAQLFLFAVMEAGTPQLVAQHRAKLVGARDQLSSSLYGRSEDVARKSLKSLPEPAAAAALALAAAAQLSNDPFKDPDFKRLSREAGRSPELAAHAIIWWSTTLDFDWRWTLVDSPGSTPIWRAVVDRPPRDTALLSALAVRAAYLDRTDEGVALARLVLGRRDATEQDRNAASFIISSAEYERQRLPPTRETVTATLADCRAYGFCLRWAQEAVPNLSVADWASIAAATVAAARAEGEPLRKTVMFAAASEAYRLSQNRDTAIKVAREGLPFVPLALTRPKSDGIEVAGIRGVILSDDAVAPAIALYRAGAQAEALASGYLSGYARYRNAAVAGETPDARWIVSDRSKDAVNDMLRDLMETPQVDEAARFYEALRCGGAAFYEYERALLEGRLAVTAALAGHPDAVRRHLEAAATALDNDSVLGDLHALEVAADWRRAILIAGRVKAAADAPPTSCGVAQ